MSGYILDHRALIAGLGATGSEHQRREISRLLHSAIDGGPTLAVPALALASATALRPGIAEHVAALLSKAPAGALDVPGLTRTPQLDAVREAFPHLDWPTIQVIVQAVISAEPILTSDAAPYAGIPVDVLLL